MTFLLETLDTRKAWILREVVVAPSFRILREVPIFGTLLALPTLRLRPVEAVVVTTIPSDTPCILVAADRSRTATTVGNYLASSTS